MRLRDKAGAPAVAEISDPTDQGCREEIFLHVFAPVLTEYVEWVLGEAVRAGKKRLYFLARDGYMMYGLAQRLAAARKLDLDIRYLRVSRYAVRSAEYYFAGKAALDTLCVGGIDVSFEKIMKRAGLTGDEALAIAQLAGYRETYTTALNYRQIQKLKETLSHIDQLFVCIREHSGDSYDATVSYLRQEGLLEEVPCALVDSGWVGTLQLGLQRVLEHETGRPVRLEGYYFGIYERPKDTDSSQYRAFYFGENRGVARDIRRRVHFSNCLFETVFSSPEGMTLGYRLSRGVSPPVCEAIESESKNPNAGTVRRFAELATQYASAYLEVAAGSVGSAFGHGEAERDGASDFAESLLAPMMGSPTLREAEAFGGLLFCDDVLELQLQPVAAEWDGEEIRRQRFLNRLLVRMNLKPGILHESAWAEGSITRLGGKVDKNMRQERVYKSLMYFRKAVDFRRKADLAEAVDSTEAIDR